MFNMKGISITLFALSCFLLTTCSDSVAPLGLKMQLDSTQKNYRGPSMTPFGLAAHINTPLPQTNGICLKGNIFQLSVDTYSLPDLNGMTPVGHLKATTLNVPPQDWAVGFPGSEALYEWFAIDYRGNIRIDAAGTYYFSLKSDDGLVLWIDGVKVSDNDGIHPPWDPVETGSIILSVGIHQVQVWYFQGPRYHVALQVLINKDSPAPAVIDSVTGGFIGESLNYIFDMDKIGAPN